MLNRRERPLKKFIFYVFFVFLCGFSIFFGYRHLQSSKYEKTAVPYIRQVLPVISSWDPTLIKDYMAPEVLARFPDQSLQELMASLSQIGTLEKIENIAFKNKSSGENITRDRWPLVTYELEARYSSGDVVVTIGLLDKGDAFDVYHFMFQAEALAPESN